MNLNISISASQLFGVLGTQRDKLNPFSSKLMTVIPESRFVNLFGEFSSLCAPPTFSYVVGDIAAMYHLKYYKQHGGATFIRYLCKNRLKDYIIYICKYVFSRNENWSHLWFYWGLEMTTWIKRGGEVNGDPKMPIFVHIQDKIVIEENCCVDLI